jgi:hypothetical protein
MIAGTPKPAQKLRSPSATHINPDVACLILVLSAPHGPEPQLRPIFVQIAAQEQEKSGSPNILLDDRIMEQVDELGRYSMVIGFLQYFRPGL